MSSKAQKLSSDHKKVIDTIGLYRNINLISTAGDPVNEYEIEYKIRGYSFSAKGEIKISKKHRIRIKLPFGYPHFPPTVKPLGPIFHPDIDAHVVRIADYWEEHRSLPEFVIHLGEMISGNIFNTDNPFNQKAADYYLENKDNLPLDSLELIESPEEEEESGILTDYSAEEMEVEPTDEAIIEEDIIIEDLVEPHEEDIELASISLEESTALQYEEIAAPPPVQQEYQLDEAGQPITVIEEKPVKLAVPVFKIILFACLLTFLGGSSGLFLYEKYKLQQLEEGFRIARNLAEDLEYPKAQAKASSVKRKMEPLYMLQSSQNGLSDDIDSFLRSEPLLQGLKGLVKYEGKYIAIKLFHTYELFKPLIIKAEKFAEKDNLTDAIETYENALAIASTNKLETDSEKIRRPLAELKLKHMLVESEKAHTNKNWAKSVAEYRKILAFLKKDGQYLLADSKKKASKVPSLLHKDTIELYSANGSLAEKRKEWGEAVKNYNALIDYIGKSGSQSNTAMQNLLVETIQKAALSSEKLNISQNIKWLMVNYKNILLKHHPAVTGANLTSPQANFIRYDEKNHIYDLSCLEVNQGSAARLKIFVQFNPESQEWSVYNGQI